MQLTSTATPWWKFGHVWLVLSGPAVVVVASFITFYLAAVGQDPVIDENYYQHGVELNKTRAANPTSLTPSTLARNNAATAGAVPK